MDLVIRSPELKIAKRPWQRRIEKKGMYQFVIAQPQCSHRWDYISMLDWKIEIFKPSKGGAVGNNGIFIPVQHHLNKSVS